MYSFDDSSIYIIGHTEIVIGNVIAYTSKENKSDLLKIKKIIYVIYDKKSHSLYCCGFF
ncbi:MAG: hypothetical protein K0S61_4751 [Anaerocolumna sp.]|jgi:hypothetical protein|nr:hypothetical protein [Anaerocolumna sp.]